jgi:hypothetical protein
MRCSQAHKTVGYLSSTPALLQQRFADAAASAPKLDCKILKSGISRPDFSQ